MIELRVRNRVTAALLEANAGKVLGPADYDVLLTGPARVLTPTGKPLCIYLPGALHTTLDQAEVYEVLHSLRKLRTDNRGQASGSAKILYGAHSTRRRALNVPSTLLGSVDPIGAQRYCRLTAWTGRNLPQWETLHPLLRQIAAHLAEWVPDRHAAQAAAAARTHPEWLIPGTPFTTVTINNTWPTGQHVDRGDLDAGFSTIACLRRGTYTGGQLIFPEYRTAVDLHHGDLILMDAHQWHANAAITCTCGNRLTGPCKGCGAERISIVSYFRTEVAHCGTAAQEAARAEHDRARKASP